MDGFIFYILLVVVAALASMLCSCLWKHYRNRAFETWQQQQLLAYQQAQGINNTTRPLVIGIFQGPSDVPFIIHSHEETGVVVPAAPPAYSEVVNHPHVYPTQDAAVAAATTSPTKSISEELPPPYSDLPR